MVSETSAAATAGAALRSAAGRTAALLGTVPDPNAAVPGLDWTAADTAAHLAAELRNYYGFVMGTVDAREDIARAGNASTPAEHSASANAAHLAKFPERDLGLLADSLVPAVDAFLTAAAQRRADERILTATGLAMSVATMTTALLGEQLIHGLDIARAARHPWPIGRADALHVIAGVMNMVPDYVDSERAAGVHIAYELRLRGGPRYGLLIDDGNANIIPAGGRVDCRISADPAAFLLVGYGRVSQWSQIVRGRMTASGRKPWLGFAFGQLLTGP